MGTLAETAIVDYRRLPIWENKLPFYVSAYSKQAEVCYFCFPIAANKRKSPFFVSSVCMCVYIYLHLYFYLYAAIPNRKRKPRQFSLIRLLLTHCANGSLSFVHLLIRKQTQVIIHLQTN